MNGSKLKARAQRIEALTEEARRDPKAFEAELKRLMVLGRLYVQGVLAFLALLIVGALWSIPLGGGLAAVFTLWIFGGVTWFAFRSLQLWSKPPDGLALKRSEVPALFDMIDDARREAGLRNIHRVLLLEDLNAAALAFRTRGIFGKRQNYLMVGLPLMHAIPTNELRVILAHECAHLTDAHAQTHLRISQMHAWQHVALNAMRDEALGGFMFRPFFKWFLPRFVERSLVYQRELELDADHHGINATDPLTAARLAVRIEVTSHRFAERWNEELLVLLAENEEPPPGFNARRCAIVAEPFEPGDERYLALAVARKTAWRYTHPALRDRLAACGVDISEVNMPTPVERSAAQELLGDMADTLAERLDDQHKDFRKAWWGFRHAAVYAEYDELRILDHDGRFGELSDADRRRRALLIARFRKSESDFARAELEALVDPETEDSAELIYALGQLRLRAGDQSGVELLERAAKRDPDLVVASHEEVGAFHAAQGNQEEAEASLASAADAVDAQMDSQLERLSVSDTMPVESHALGHPELAALQDMLTRERDVAEAWLAKRTLQNEAGRPVYVLMVRDDLEGKALFIGKARAKLFQGLYQRVSIQHADVLVVPLVEPLYGLWQRMRKLDGAHVYLKRGEQPYN